MSNSDDAARIEPLIEETITYPHSTELSHSVIPSGTYLAVLKQIEALLPDLLFSVKLYNYMINKDIL
jgi:hypothetical protein